MKIKAKFKGKSDEDYLNGENYELRFKTTTTGLKNKPMIQINKPVKYQCGFCFYSSLRAFLNNWQVF